MVQVAGILIAGWTFVAVPVRATTMKTQQLTATRPVNNNHDTGPVLIPSLAESPALEVLQSSFEVSQGRPWPMVLFLDSCTLRVPHAERRRGFSSGTYRTKLVLARFVQLETEI